MQETLYRPHAADGTHYCDNKDRIGWIKGSTLDDLTNKVHGTLDLEPVNVDFDANEFGVASIFLLGLVLWRQLYSINEKLLHNGSKKKSLLS